MIAAIDDGQIEAATDLLCRFFREEGFVGDRELIRANLNALRNDAHQWAAVCITDGKIAGIVTVTTMLYVEWGRLGEIGDLYVVPESWLNPRSPTLRIRGCTYCPGAPGKETIWAWADGLSIWEMSV